MYLFIFNIVFGPADLDQKEMRKEHEKQVQQSHVKPSVGEKTPPSSREGESTPEQMSSTQKSEMLMRERAPLTPRVTYI